MLGAAEGQGRGHRPRRHPPVPVPQPRRPRRGRRSRATFASCSSRPRSTSRSGRSTSCSSTPGEGPAFESYRQGLFNNRLWLQKADGSRFEHNGGFSNTASDDGQARLRVSLRRRTRQARRLPARLRDPEQGPHDPAGVRVQGCAAAVSRRSAVGGARPSGIGIGSRASEPLEDPLERLVAQLPKPHAFRFIEIKRRPGPRGFRSAGERGFRADRPPIRIPRRPEPAGLAGRRPRKRNGSRRTGMRSTALRVELSSFCRTIPRSSRSSRVAGCRSSLSSLSRVDSPSGVKGSSPSRAPVEISSLGSFWERLTGAGVSALVCWQSQETGCSAAGWGEASADLGLVSLASRPGRSKPRRPAWDAFRRGSGWGLAVGGGRGTGSSFCGSGSVVWEMIGA